MKCEWCERELKKGYPVVCEDCADADEGDLQDVEEQLIEAEEKINKLKRKINKLKKENNDLKISINFLRSEEQSL